MQCTWTTLWIGLSYTVQLGLTADDIQLINTNCGRNIHVKEGTKYQLKWDGRKLRSSCQVTFTNPDPDKYKLIVENDVFQVNDCDFLMSYKYNGRVRQKYSCRSTVFRNEFSKLDEFTFVFKTGSDSSSKLEIEVTIVLDEEPKISEGELLLGIPAVIIMVIIILCIFAKKKGFNFGACISNCNRRSPGRRDTTSTHQSAPEPEITVERRLSDLNGFDDTARHPPPSTVSSQATLHHDKPPPSYTSLSFETCV